jgi:hypothetical protein
MKRNITTTASAIAALSLLAACTTIPDGPAVTVLPGTGKSFDQFRYDDADCRQFASGQTGGKSAAAAATDSGVLTAAVGTAVGAAAGAAINGSQGAGAGAGVGLLMGSLIGAGTADASGYNMQYRYDNAYQQCMYAKGHRVPAAANTYSYRSYRQPYYGGYYGGYGGYGNYSGGYGAPPPQTGYIPPPPPGTPGPPPPR